MPTDLTELLRDHARFVEARCPDGEAVAADMRAAADEIENLHEIKRFLGNHGILAAQAEHNRMMAEKDAAIERLRASITEAVDTFTQDRCLWDWVHRVRRGVGLEPLREYEEKQPVVDAQAAKIDRLVAWIERTATCKHLRTQAGYHGRRVSMEAEKILREAAGKCSQCGGEREDAKWMYCRECRRKAREQKARNSAWH